MYKEEDTERERSYLLKLASSMLSVCGSVCEIGVVSELYDFEHDKRVK